MVEGMHPAPHGVLVAVQPLGNLGTAPAIHQQQNAVVPLAEPDIMCPPKGTPDLIACDGGIGNRHHYSGPPNPSSSLPYTAEPENPGLFCWITVDKHLEKFDVPQ
jgi:hypothetical protein